MGDLRLIVLRRFVSPPMRDWRCDTIIVAGAFGHEIVSEISNVDPSQGFSLTDLAD